MTRNRLLAAAAAAALALPPAARAASNINQSIPIPIPANMINFGAPFQNVNGVVQPIFGNAANQFAQGDDARIAGALEAANNLSDVANAATALANLGGAPLASPSFTGTPTAPTPATSDNSTRLATTAYVQAQGYVTAGTAPVTTVFGRAGAVTAQGGDYSFSQISGSVAASQLPNPTVSTLGGVQAIAAVGHEWVSAISSLGAPALSQPAASDLSSAAFTQEVTAPDGAGCTAGALSFAGGTSTTTGLRIVSNAIDFCANGATPFQINSAAFYTASNTTGLELRAATGTAAAPNIVPNLSKSDAGLFADAAGDVSVAVDNAGTGAEAARFKAAAAYFANAVQVGSLTALTLSSGEIGLAKIAASGTAPGAAGGKLELVCGSSAGTAKLIAYAGTSTTPTTIVDNIGAGVTGC